MEANVCSCRRGFLVVVCGLLFIVAGSGWSQTAVSVRPTFAVTSVKPCRREVEEGTRTGGVSSPGLLGIDCHTVRDLIQLAYAAFASGQRVTSSKIPVEGGPAWINSERYDIKARAESPESQVMMNGPMLQTLLEDRFQLRIHQETRDVPIYALRVAKGGARLKPFKEGTCNPYDIAATFPPPPTPENPCRTKATIKDGVLILDVQGATLDDLARFYLDGLDRPVIDKSGIRGRFDFHLEFTPDENPGSGRRDKSSFPTGAAASDPSGPSLFTAVQEQTGLKLEPTTGPGQYLVIDRVEKPSAN